MWQCIFFLLIHTQAFAWHYAFPTVGHAAKVHHLEKDASLFLPHCFSLQQLCTNLGSGITIALFDSVEADAFHAQHGMKTIYTLAPKSTILWFPLRSSNREILRKQLDNYCHIIKQKRPSIIAIPLALLKSEKELWRELSLSGLDYSVTIVIPVNNNINLASVDFLFDDTRVIKTSAFGCNKQQLFLMHQASIEQSDYLLPGINIVQQINGSDICMSGNSCACTLMAGFFSCIYGEFFSLFSYDIIDYAINCSSVHLLAAWKHYARWGTPDFRAASFILHVLKKYIQFHGISAADHVLCKKILSTIYAFLLQPIPNAVCFKNQYWYFLQHLPPTIKQCDVRELHLCTDWVVKQIPLIRG